MVMEIKKFNEEFEADVNTFFLIKHKSGLFLKNEYVTASNRRSAVTLVDNEFTCFTSEKSAQNYINEGDELFYSYNQELKKEDLTIIKLTER